MFSHNGSVARHVYSYAATEHDKHNSRDFNQSLLNDKDRKYSLLVAHGGDVCYLQLPCSFIWHCYIMMSEILSSTSHGKFGPDRFFCMLSVLQLLGGAYGF